MFLIRGGGSTPLLLKNLSLRRRASSFLAVLFIRLVESSWWIWPLCIHWSSLYWAVELQLFWAVYLNEGRVADLIIVGNWSNGCGVDVRWIQSLLTDFEEKSLKTTNITIERNDFYSGGGSTTSHPLCSDRGHVPLKVFFTWRPP